MKLVIHDLNEDEWRQVAGSYAGWTVVDDSSAIRPCIGCFRCWNKDPGRCVIRDGYENMGALIHHADEVVVISRYTFGGFSGFVKNVFDRCLGYVLPQFEVIDGETHHKKRYDEDKPFTFIFRGPELTEEEKAAARRYVRAVCANFRGHVSDVIFRQNGETPAAPVREPVGADAAGGVVLLNGSMRSRNGNSAKLARALAGRLSGTPESIDLKDHLRDLPALVRRLDAAETIVLCVPLYVDGLPSQVIRLMEEFRRSGAGGAKRIYVLANMGLYESCQLVNLFEAVRQWCGLMGFAYGGGLGVSAGELLGTLMETIPLGLGPTRNVFEGMKKLASAIDRGESPGELYAEPYMFPRGLYIFIANTNWDRTARKNGLRPRDLYRRL